MLFELIASIILLGMMAIPLINIIVGLVAGAAIAGVPGALTGLALAVIIMAAWQLVGIGWSVAEQERALPGEARLADTRARRRRKLLRKKRHPLLPGMPAYLRDRLPLVTLADGFNPQTADREKRSAWLH